MVGQERSGLLLAEKIWGRMIVCVENEQIKKLQEM